jgi:hypothetical protein
MKRGKKVNRTFSFRNRITLVILSSMLLAASTFPLVVVVRGSIGNILVESKTLPSPPKTVQAGGNVSLYFGKVDFSGGEMTLYFSRDGFASINQSADIKYGPTVIVADIRNTTITNYPGGYKVGNNWINGSIPKEVSGGKWYIKAYDGDSTSVAVTDNHITITCLFEVEPDSGPGQAAITLKGYGYTPKSHVNLSYSTNGGATWTPIEGLVDIGEDGLLEYNTTAIDLGLAINMASDYEWRNSTITFRAISPECIRTTDFAEFWRGLLQVDGETATTGQLYGNGTDFTGTVQLKVYEDLIIAGKWFHPGLISIFWDDETLLDIVTADKTGFFNASVTVPESPKGEHNVTINDGKISFTVSVTVIPTLILTPSRGPVGIEVTAEIYGFLPKGLNNMEYNVTLNWDYTDFLDQLQSSKNVSWALTDHNGSIVTTFTVPRTTGGDHSVTAVDNATTQVAAIFTVTPDLKITPTEFTNNGTEVTVYGTGLEFGVYYDLNIANMKDELVIYGNSTGDLTFEFVAGASFSPGIHIISLYRRQLLNLSLSQPILEKYILFNVTAVEETEWLLYNMLNTSLAELAEYLSRNSDILQTDLIQTREDILDWLESFQPAIQEAILAAVQAKAAAEATQTSINEAKAAAEAASQHSANVEASLDWVMKLSLATTTSIIIVLILLLVRRSKTYLRLASGPFESGAPTLSISTDKAKVPGGEFITIKGTLKTAAQTPMAEQDITVYCAQRKVATTKTNRNGEYRVRIAAPADVEKAEYHVEATIDEETLAKLQKTEKTKEETI